MEWPSSSQSRVLATSVPNFASFIALALCLWKEQGRKENKKVESVDGDRKERVFEVDVRCRFPCRRFFSGHVKTLHQTVTSHHYIFNTSQRFADLDVNEKLNKSWIKW